MRSFLARLSTGSRSSKTPEPPTSPNGHKINGGGHHQLAHDEHEFFRTTASTSASGVGATKEWNAEFASEPAAWENAFLKCWQRLRTIIVSKSAKQSDRDAFIEIKMLVSNMCNFLIMEITSQPEPIIGPILEHCFNKELFRHLHNWAVRTSPAMVPRYQVMLLETYECLIDRTQSNYFLIHKPILLSLLRLLAWCRSTSNTQRVPTSEVDKYFVRLLNRICKKIAEESHLLEFFFNSPLSSEWEFHDEEDAAYNGGDVSGAMNGNGSGGSLCDEMSRDGPFLVFSLLIPYMHAADDTGQLARDALLQIMSVSRQLDYVARHVAESTFCAVLATGLSAYWSQLPKCICTALCITNTDEFHKLNLQTDLEFCGELVEFHKALLFCNAVVQHAHSEITRQIIHYFYDGFLCKVFKAAVEQLDDDELVSIIVYYHLCLDTITEESLIQALLKVLIVADTTRRDMNLMEFILSKMNNSEKLCRVVLSLLRMLLELRCEDLLWSCLIRFILPFIPLKSTRRFDVNISLSAADRFLSCIPTCTHAIPELNSKETFASYLKEAAETVQDATNCCKTWAFKYDGIRPNSLLNMSAPEELLSTRQPFIRLSSARSSFASNGLNRYFQDRSAHGTQDSTLLMANDYYSGGGGGSGNGATPAVELPPLNKLGEDDSKELLQSRDYDKFDSLLDSGQDDFSDFNSQYEMADNPQLDYFHFTYEGISSESDEMSNSRRNSTSDEGPKQLSNGIGSDDGMLASSSTNSAALGMSAYAKAILATDWEAVTRNVETFYAALDALPPKRTPPIWTRRTAHNGYSRLRTETNPTSYDVAHTVEENMALIEARYQYLKEVSAERAELEDRYDSETNPFRLDLSGGGSSGFCSGGGGGTVGQAATPSMSASSTALPRRVSGVLLTCTDERGSGLLLESLFSALEKLMDRSFPTNLQLIGVLSALLSYPQPVMTSYLLYVDALKSNALLRITNVLENLKVRIDAYASSTDGFEEMMRRGVRHKITRAERFEKSGWSNGSANASPVTTALTSADSSPLNNSMVVAHRRRAAFSARQGGTADVSRYFLHKAVESEEHSADASRSRNFAYAAILLSQLCQMCAAFALQHNTPPLFNNQPSGLTGTSGGSGGVGGACFSTPSTPGR